MSDLTRINVLGISGSLRKRIVRLNRLEASGGVP